MFRSCYFIAISFEVGKRKLAKKLFEFFAEYLGRVRRGTVAQVVQNEI